MPWELGGWPLGSDPSPSAPLSVAALQESWVWCHHDTWFSWPGLWQGESEDGLPHSCQGTLGKVCVWGCNLEPHTQVVPISNILPPKGHWTLLSQGDLQIPCPVWRWWPEWFSPQSYYYDISTLWSIFRDLTICLSPPWDSLRGMAQEWRMGLSWAALLCPQVHLQLPCWMGVPTGL